MFEPPTMTGALPPEHDTLTDLTRFGAVKMLAVATSPAAAVAAWRPPGAPTNVISHTDSLWLMLYGAAGAAAGSADQHQM